MGVRLTLRVSGFSVSKLHGSRLDSLRHHSFFELLQCAAAPEIPAADLNFRREA
jgi:hypothetical protein